ncbi:hypothetical protein Taro_022452 [Colocasia esculenta]|uniref:CNNM transmembrane domain-containing protein n=1 Tax=Colocasia esculenta TaxID=4460 RepID=A0A843V7Y3_COLES|nr:hypothetical protein [Colocasia esculenta]
MQWCVRVEVGHGLEGFYWREIKYIDNCRSSEDELGDVTFRGEYVQKAPPGENKTEESLNKAPHDRSVSSRGKEKKRIDGEEKGRITSPFPHITCPTLPLSPPESDRDSFVPRQPPEDLRCSFPAPIYSIPSGGRVVGSSGSIGGLAAAMHPINVLAVARMAVGAAAGRGNGFFIDGLQEADDIALGSFWWYFYAGLSCVLVLFAGLMSGLTLGLMSLGLVDLEVLQQGGTPTEKKQAATILPVVQKQHQLLVTLLFCNAAAMEALPIFLDKIFHPFVAVVLSVTFVLAFGEIIPQAICSRYGLAVGANCVWVVRILMIVSYPIAYPIGKILDCLLGHNESALFRRAQLKVLVSIHSKEAGKGGELTHDETTIISGALDLTEKTAEEAMTPIESTFSLDVDSKLDWEAIGKILARGHSRVPVYSGNPKNIIGLLLVKSLLTVRAETETPVSAVSIRRIPRVPADMPLYDILNEFQKGSSHMAAVVKAKVKSKIDPASDTEKMEESKEANVDTKLTPLLSKPGESPENVVIDIDKEKSKQVTSVKPSLQQNDVAANAVGSVPEDIEDGEVIGIITLEDVFEELLQEEIVDETDEYVDVHKRIRVAAAAAASSVARAPSIRRLTGQKVAGAQNRQGQQPVAGPKKSVERDSNSNRGKPNLTEPLLGNKR